MFFFIILKNVCANNLNVNLKYILLIKNYDLLYIVFVKNDFIYVAFFQVSDVYLYISNVYMLDIKMVLEDVTLMII